MVPTVERGFFDMVFCSMLMTGLRPVIWSTFGPFQPTEELTCIGRKCFEVSALAFSIERVECQTGLCRCR